MKHTAVLLSLLAAMSAQNTPSANKGRHLDIPAISREANGSIVSIVMSDKDGHPIAQGSGFLVSKNGRVVTNYHVIKNGASAIIKLPTGAFFAVDGVLAFDKNHDVAVIKAHGRNFQTVALGDSDRLQVGEEVVAIGSPLSLESTVSNGIVSGIRNDDGRKLLQITAPISHGSSGGPLFNMAGEVVGITSSALIGGENLNFAVPINDAKARLVGSLSNVRPFPDEPEEVDNAPSPTLGEPKLAYGQHVDREGKSHYAFHADCSAVGNVESCSIFNELAGNDESGLFNGLVAFDESLVCFTLPESKDDSRYAKVFSVFSFSTHIAKDPDDLDAYSMITYYKNGVLAEYIRQFYLVPSPFDDSFTVTETGRDLNSVSGSLSKEEFSYRGDNWYDASLLTGRMTVTVNGRHTFERCFSFTRPQWEEQKTDDDEKAKERQQYAAKIKAKVAARENARAAESQRRYDCIMNSYRPYCARCSEGELETFMVLQIKSFHPDERAVRIINYCESKAH